MLTLSCQERVSCVSVCVCVRLCLSLSLWALPVWKRLRTVGLSSIFCSGCLTTVLQFGGSTPINRPWGLLRTNLGLSLPTEASKHLLWFWHNQSPALIQESTWACPLDPPLSRRVPRLSVFLCRGFPSCKPRETALACAKGGTLPPQPRAPLAPAAQPPCSPAVSRGRTGPRGGGCSSMVATVLLPVASSLFLLPERLAESLPLWQKHVFAFASPVWVLVCSLVVFLEHFPYCYPFPCCSQLLCCSALSNQSLF